MFIKNILYKTTIFMIIVTCLSSCIPNSKIVVKIKALETSLNFSVANIQVINHQIVITGTNLNSVTAFKIKEGATTTNLIIESKSNTSIVANTIANVTFAAGKVFDFVLSNASAASTFTVNFSLCDSTLGGKGFNCIMVPNDKDVLSFDAATDKWIPRNVNGLNYKATFDASPGVDPGGDPQAGDYYIISVPGTINTVSYVVGDWIVYNADDLAWQKVSNSQDVLSVFGRTGKISAKEGDYNLAKMSDVVFASAPVLNDVLMFDGTNWVPGVVSAGAGGTVTSVTGTAPVSVATGTTTPVISMLPADGTNSGYLTTADWTTFNNKQAAITAGTTAQYYRGDKSFQTLDTLAVPENTNLYFTNARVLGVPLTGLNTALTGAVTATDTVLEAFGRTQNQLDALSTGGSNYLVKNGTDSITGVVNVGTTGLLQLGYTPVGANDATNKAYVDSGYALKVSKDGDTMTGDLTLDTNLKIKGGSNYVTINGHATSAAYNLTLPSTAGTAGYVLSTDGATGNTSWVAQPSAPVTSVFGRTGVVAATAGDYTATLVTNTAAGNIAATNVQTAIDELDTEKQSIASFATDLRATVLTGLSTATNAVITATDTVLGAFGQLQAQISAQATSIAAKADLTNGSQTITTAVVTGLTPPVAGSDAVNKTYVDSYGQWSKTGSDIYRESGNVGIGTSTPSYAFDLYSASDAIARIKGEWTSKLSLYGPGRQIVELIANNGAAPWQMVAQTDGSLTFKASDNVNAGTVSDLTLKGHNVGIGTTSPSSFLSLDGTAARTISLERNTTAATAGQNLTVSSGGAISGTADLNGGDLNLQSGIATGTGASNIYFNTATAQTTGTTDNAPSTKMTILGSGSVGIATMAPASMFSVGSSSQFRVASNGSISSYSGYNSGISLFSGTGGYGLIQIASPNGGGGRIRFANGQSGWAHDTSIYRSGANALVIDNNAGGAASLEVKGSAFLATSSGNVGIGTTAPDYKLHVVGASGATVGYFSDGTATCSITPATAGSVSCSSDERLKKNIQDYTDSLSLENVLKLKTVTYEWKKINNGRHTGYIAQEVEKVAPEFVTTGKDGFKQVSYAGFIPWITGAIKAFYGEFKTVIKRVMNLEQKITKLETENAALKSKLETENAALKSKFESDNAVLKKRFEAENAKLQKDNEEMKNRLMKIEKILIKNR